MAEYPDQTRNLNPTPEARFAISRWSEDYASQDGGVMDFWDTLSKRRKRISRDAVQGIIDAAKTHKRLNAEGPEDG